MDELRDKMKVTKTHLQEARDWTAQHNIEFAKERERSRHAESELLEALDVERERLRVAKLELMMARRAESAIGIRRRHALLILDRVARRVFRDTKSRAWRTWSSNSSRLIRRARSYLLLV